MEINNDIINDLKNIKINIKILKNTNEIGIIKKNYCNDNYCSICLKKISINNNFKLLDKCNHGFHIKCINNWLVNNNTCPKCRHEY